MTDIFILGAFAQDLITAFVITIVLVLGCTVIQSWS